MQRWYRSAITLVFTVFETYLLDVTEFPAVAAHGNADVLDEASRTQALKVLLGALGPPLRHLGTTRLGRELDRQNVLAGRVADEVDNSHVGRDLLLLGDEVDAEIVLAQSLLDDDEAKVVGNGASVCTQAKSELVEVFLLGGVDDGSPGILGRQLRYTGPVDDTTLLAVDSLVALLIAEAALVGFGVGAVCAVVAN